MLWHLKAANTVHNYYLWKSTCFNTEVCQQLYYIRMTCIPKTKHLLWFHGPVRRKWRRTGSWLDCSWDFCASDRAGLPTSESLFKQRFRKCGVDGDAEGRRSIWSIQVLHWGKDQQRLQRDRIMTWLLVQLIKIQLKTSGSSSNERLGVGEGKSASDKTGHRNFSQIKEQSCCCSLLMC